MMGEVISLGEWAAVIGVGFAILSSLAGAIWWMGATYSQVRANGRAIEGLDHRIDQLERHLCLPKPRSRLLGVRTSDSPPD